MDCCVVNGNPTVRQAESGVGRSQKESGRLSLQKLRRPVVVKKRQMAGRLRQRFDVDEEPEVPGLLDAEQEAHVDGSSVSERRPQGYRSSRVG